MDYSLGQYYSTKLAELVIEEEERQILSRECALDLVPCPQDKTLSVNLGTNVDIRKRTLLLLLNKANGDRN